MFCTYVIYCPILQIIQMKTSGKDLCFFIHKEMGYRNSIVKRQYGILDPILLRYLIISNTIT